MKVKAWARIFGTNTTFETEVDVSDDVLAFFRSRGEEKITDIVSAVVYEELVKDMIFEWSWEEVH